MRKIFWGFLVAMVASSCEYNNLDVKCYEGTVIASSCCTGSSFINIDSSAPIGKPTKWNGIDYNNMIQVPGYLNQGKIYLKLRSFDPKKDQALFPPGPCYCLVAVAADVPVWLTLASSYSSCASADH
jgi:hypothetical protein